jgi:hypothetical protein
LLPALPDIRLVRTDIAGFFGFAERGPLVDPSEPNPGVRAQAAVKLTSWDDFRRAFGGFLPYSYLAYAVRGFFATGGETCYVVRVGVAKTPPAVALMPLPAAIISTQIASSTLTAQLSGNDSGSSAAQGQADIQLDVPVSLPVTSVIAIGDSGFKPQFTVTSVIDSQNITVQPPLDSTQAGAPVFALTGPAVATPITSVTTVSTIGATQIQLDSTDVNGIEQGSLIAIGDPIGGECVSVASVVDDQVITVQPALTSAHAVGEQVYPIAGSALTVAAAKGNTILQVGSTTNFAKDDLVSIEGGGVTEIRVLTADPTASTIQLGLPLNSPYDTGTVVRKYTAALTVSAYSAGQWGNRIRLTIKPLDNGNAVTHFSMLVSLDQGDDLAQPLQQEFYPLLSLDPYDPYPLTSADSSSPPPPPGSPTPTSSIYVVKVINNASNLIQVNVPATPPQVLEQKMQLLVNNGPLQTSDLYLEGGYDGSPATTPMVSFAPAFNPCSGTVAAAPTPSAGPPYPSPPMACEQDFYDALDVLGLVDEIGILSCPDAAGPPQQMLATPGWSMTDIQQAMVNQCMQRQYRVAVLDTPMSLTPAQALKWRNQLGYQDPVARFAAVYYPWLKVPDELGIEGPNRTVPPSGHVAGAYAYTDNNSGVQKPPANVELQFVSDLQLEVTSQQQGFLNPAGVNCIRPFPGRGIRVWGARSLSQDPNWRYIHRRRLMSMIEDSVEQASRWVVFRTNDDDLQRMLTHSLNVFLQTIWLAGGLLGARPSEGYFVKCDSTNNTPTTIDAGQLVCQVGVAVAAPMEFLVFEMRRSVAGAQVVEA